MQCVIVFKPITTNADWIGMCVCVWYEADYSGSLARPIIKTALAPIFYLEIAHEIALKRSNVSDNAQRRRGERSQRTKRMKTNLVLNKNQYWNKVYNRCVVWNAESGPPTMCVCVCVRASQLTAAVENKRKLLGDFFLAFFERSEEIIVNWLFIKSKQEHFKRSIKIVTTSLQFNPQVHWNNSG